MEEGMKEIMFSLSLFVLLIIEDCCSFHGPTMIYQKVLLILNKQLHYTTVKLEDLLADFKLFEHSLWVFIVGLMSKLQNKFANSIF